MIEDLKKEIDVEVTVVTTDQPTDAQTMTETGAIAEETLRPTTDAGEAQVVAPLVGTPRPTSPGASKPSSLMFHSRTQRASIQRQTTPSKEAKKGTDATD